MYSGVTILGGGGGKPLEVEGSSDSGYSNGDTLGGTGRFSLKRTVERLSKLGRSLQKIFIRNPTFREFYKYFLHLGGGVLLRVFCPLKSHDLLKDSSRHLVNV